MRLRHVFLFRWILVDFRQPGSQNLIQKVLPSLINPHDTTIPAAAPNMCKPLHRSTPGWGALHSNCRCCGDQYEEHGPKQASSFCLGVSMILIMKRERNWRKEDGDGNWNHSLAYEVSDQEHSFAEAPAALLGGLSHSTLLNHEHLFSPNCQQILCVFHWILQLNFVLSAWLSSSRLFYLP